MELDCVVHGCGKAMSSGSCNPVDRGCVCPVLKDALAKKYVPETGRKEYLVGLVEEMAVDPLPAGKGKRTIEYWACRTSPFCAKLIVALGWLGREPFHSKAEASSW